MAVNSSGDMIPNPEEQKKTIKPLISQELDKNDVWYLIEQRWFKQWKQYVGLDEYSKGVIGEKSTYPGPIDNRPLFEESCGTGSVGGDDASSNEGSPTAAVASGDDESSDTMAVTAVNGSSSTDEDAAATTTTAPMVYINQGIREKLVDEMDYTLVPAEAWTKLAAWYGMVDDRQAVPRKVIEQGMFVKNLRVEVYLTRIELCEFTKMDTTISRYFSKAQTVDVIEKVMRQLFNIPDNRECRLYSKYMTNTFDNIKKEQCIQLFMTEEKLSANDPWYCPVCKEHKEATKKFDLWSLPKVLVIHLKRFQYNRYWRDKIDTFVNFPITDLDMSPYIINAEHGPAMYQLICVSNHYGGLGGGHYTASCQSEQTSSTWHYYDDTRVSPCTPESAQSKAAYVLFYQRCDLPPVDPTVNPALINAGSEEVGGELMLTNGNAAAAGAATPSQDEDDDDMDIN